MWRMELPSRWRQPWRWHSTGGCLFPCDPQQPSDRALTLWEFNALPAATVLTTAPPRTEITLRFGSLPLPTFSADPDHGRPILWRETHAERSIWILPGASPGASLSTRLTFHKPL